MNSPDRFWPQGIECLSEVCQELDFKHIHGLLFAAMMPVLGTEPSPSSFTAQTILRPLRFRGRSWQQERFWSSEPLLRGLYRLSYRAKLLITISAVGFITLSLLVLNRLYLLTNILEERTIARLDDLGRILGENCLDEILEGNHEHLRDAIATAAGQPRVCFVSLIKVDNSIMVSSKPEFEHKVNPIKDSESLKSMAGEMFVKSYRLVRDGECYGSIQIGFAMQEVRRELRHTMLWALFLSALSLTLLLVVAWVMTIVLLRPLEDMKMVARRIARGEFSARLEVKTKDIIGELALALNDMAEKLQRYRNDMQKMVDEALLESKEINQTLAEKTTELEQSNQRLKELDKLKSEFLSMVSHELQTPLTSIIGFAQTMIDLELKDEQRTRYLQIIETEGKRLASLIKKFLDISRIESGNFSLDIQSVDMKNIVEETTESLKEIKATTIVTAFSDADFTVEGDRDRLRQAVTNILENAVKYSAEGDTITVEGNATEEAVTISIRDQGPGIKQEDQSRVFDKYFRGKHPKDKIKKGSGLGLAIAKGIVEAHRGKIWLDSEIGNGSTFSLSIPRKADQD
ncbi:sensor histidine kinase [Acidobacteriota bacterium]